MKHTAFRRPNLPGPIWPRLCASCGLLLLLFASAAALARPTVREQLPPDAQKDWDAAQELYQAGDYRSALVHFRRAYEVSKNPRALFNVGVCWKDLTQYSQAIRVWQEELTHGLEPEDAAKAKSAILALQPFVSSLSVVADEAGAVLSIDGIEIGETPFLEPIAIDVGRRSVRLSKPGFEPLERQIDIVRGQSASVEFDLQHRNKTGEVLIEVTGPPQATLFMDGRELGPSNYTGRVPAGPHTFEARAAGYATARQTSDVAYGQQLRLSIAMAEAREEGKLRVITGHSDAEIHIDGSLLGTGAWEGRLAAGGHQLVVTKSGYDTEQIELTLSPDQERTVQVELSAERSWLFWTVALTAAIGGGTAAAVLLSRPSETPAVNGTLSTVTILPP